MVTVMQEPFPALTRLEMFSTDEIVSVFPAEFLGGSAPRLQEITLGEIPFPTLLALLLSTRNLITLTLCEIPPTGYISPEAMVVGLAALPMLEFFTIKFRLPTPGPDQIRLPLTPRGALPALTSFIFQGACKYLEDLVSRIDSPRLGQIHIDYLDRLSNVPVELAKLLDRSMGPKLTLLMHARVRFMSDFPPSPCIIEQITRRRIGNRHGLSSRVKGWTGKLPT